MSLKMHKANNNRAAITRMQAMAVSTVVLSNLRATAPNLTVR